MTSPDDTFPHNYLSTSPAHGVPGQSFLYAAPLRSPSRILLELPVPAPKSRDRYANYVWNAGVVLADKIAEGEIDVRGKRVLELGCGLGLPSLLAARMGAELVVLSDYDDPVALEDTRHAVEEALGSQALRYRCTVIGHTWGVSISPLMQRSPSGYDLILVADCVWDRALHGALIQSLRALLEASSPEATVVHFSCGFHTGRATVADFLARARSAGIGPGPGPTASEKNGWNELSVEGEVREWNWERARGGRCNMGTEKDELAHGSAGSSKSASLRLAGDEERQEERNRWTLYGTLALLELESPSRETGTPLASRETGTPLARLGQGREDALATEAFSFVNQNGVSTCTMYCMKREDFDVRVVREDRLSRLEGGAILFALRIAEVWSPLCGMKSPVRLLSFDKM